MLLSKDDVIKVGVFTL